MHTPYFEPEIAIIGELVVAIDQQLSDICEKAANTKDADEFGYYDAAEHATGLGLVACQTIIAIVCGSLKLEKSKALALGPMHPGGLSKVSNH